MPLRAEADGAAGGDASGENAISLTAMTTRFVLIQTSHAGNVGAAARAIRVMGFTELVLVAPRWPNVLRREETIQRASGATDVLARTRVVDTLDEALDGIDWLCATAMTPRDFGPPTQAPRQALAELAERAPKPSVAFLFGSERFGMSNDDVYRCHSCLSIPTDPQFGSLNLAAAVQLIAYEWRMALGGFAVADATPQARFVQVPQAALADVPQVSGLLQHWAQALTAVGYLDPAVPRRLLARLNQFVNRARPTQEEVHVLRGVAKAMIEVADKAQR